VTIYHAREEVPEVLKFTPATATLGSPAAEADAAQAAMRPLAGFGAGAFTCDGVLVGSGASARVHGRGCGAHQVGTDGISGVRTSSVRKSAVGVGTISTSHVRTSTVRTSTVRTSTAGISFVGTSTGISTAGTSTVGTQQFDLMTRISPAAPGGLGPHPAREPEPV
jgi:hypothetical protein